MRYLLPAAMLAGACLFAPSFHEDAAFAAQPAVPEKPVEMKGSKKAVLFPHAAHSGVDCVVCHHMVDGRENFQKCSTSGCHDDLAAKKGQNSLYFVTHSRSPELKQQTCLSCHSKFVAEHEDMKKPMTGCKGSKCHPE